MIGSEKDLERLLDTADERLQREGKRLQIVRYSKTWYGKQKEHRYFWGERQKSGISQSSHWLRTWLEVELWHVSRWLWLITVVPWLLFTFFLLFWQLEPQSPDAFKYLLSALSQGMAAVLALTFTISLVAAQLTARYGYQVLRRVLVLPTILYILYFALVTLLPLVFLPSNSIFQVKLSLSLGALALALLAPYLRYFFHRITPQSLLDDLSHEAAEKIKDPGPAGVTELDTIENMVMSSLAVKDYNTFSYAMDKLVDLALCAKEETSGTESGLALYELERKLHGLASGGKKEAPELTDARYEQDEVPLPNGVPKEPPRPASFHIWDWLWDIHLAILDDVLASKIYCGFLKKGSISAIARWQPQKARRFNSQLVQMGGVAISHRLEFIASMCIRSLTQVCWFAKDTDDHETLANVIEELGMIGFSAATDGLEDPTLDAVTGLMIAEQPASEAETQRLACSLAHALGMVGDAAGKSELRETTKIVAHQLYELATTGIQKNWSDAAKEVASAVRKILKNKIGQEEFGAATKHFAETFAGQQDKKKALRSFIQDYCSELGEFIT